MSGTPFCHLHIHTCYSLLNSTASVRKLVRAAAEMGMEYLAITDQAALYGAVEFYKAAYDAGIKPIIGCEMYVARHGIKVRKSRRDNMSLVLLAETQEGYENLVKLVSTAHLEGMYYKPRIDKELLRKYSKGLIGLSGDMYGELGETCQNHELEKAAVLACEYAEIFGPENFYLELFDHGLEEEKIIRANLLRTAETTELPLVVTNDVHYIRKEHAEAHDILTCLQHGQFAADTNRRRYHGQEYYLKNGGEMAALFPDCPEAVENTIKIARRCNVEFLFLEQTDKLHFPIFPLPEGIKKNRDYLVHLGKLGLKKLYRIKDIDQPQDAQEQKINERFYYEVNVIEKTNYIDYFLVVSDFVQWARRKNIPVGPGRGSGAGSLLAYSLEITTIDPLAYNLIFERFLNPDRVSPPDFDIDFCPTRRQEVIQYVRKKYGEKCVAQIITFGTLGAKTLIRDMGRVLEIPLPYCDRLAKMIPETPGITLERAATENPAFKQAIETEPYALQIMQHAPILEGLPRHTGVHAAGVVIGEKPLIEMIPLTRDQKSGLPVVQFEMGPTEEIGLLKMDFLGLKTLTIIQEACTLIKRNHNLDIDPEKLPVDDKEAFALLARGDTVGIFQLESAGMRDTLRQVRPDCIEDIIAILALYRPGPMQFIPLFTRRKHGRENISYDHPLLEPILKETYGIIVYQEQIQQAAQKLAGFSLGRGDILRRAMGKKKPEVMAQQRGKFIEGCWKTNRIDADLAGAVFDTIEKFAQYGFNKSHSTAYGFVTYQTSWLKAHYPAEFMAALLSGEIGNFDKLAGFIAEIEELGIEVLSPCINESIKRFNAVAAGLGIRFGLAAIKGVGEGAALEIVEERDANGPFTGLMDFCARIPGANKRVLESLIRSGAFDSFSIHRARLFNGIESAIGRAAETLKDRTSGQISMFELMENSKTDYNGSTDEELPNVEAWSESDMLAAEKELIGFFISGHPLARYQWEIDTFASKKGQEPPQFKAGEYIRIGGIMTDVRKLFTKKEQKPMAAFRIEGLEGWFHAVIFPGAFKKFGERVIEGEAAMFGGNMIEEENGELKFRAQEITAFEKVPELFCACVSVHLPEMGVQPQMLTALRQAVSEFHGNTPLRLCIELVEGQQVFLKTSRRVRVRPCAELMHKIEQAIGEGQVHIIPFPLEKQ